MGGLFFLKLIFYDASEDQLAHLSWVLMWFEVISSLRINLDKSEIIPVGRVENLEVFLKPLTSDRLTWLATYI